MAIFSIFHQLTFDNQKVQNVSSALIREEARLPAVSSSILFEIFPFIMVFGEDMVIQSIGRSLDQVKFFSKACPIPESHDIYRAMFQILPNLVGKKITEFFDIVRPIIEFRFEIVLARTNNIFEIATVEPLEVLLARVS